MLTKWELNTLRLRIKYQLYHNDYFYSLLQKDRDKALNSLTIWMLDTVALEHKTEVIEVVTESFNIYLMEEILNAT